MRAKTHDLDRGRVLAELKVTCTRYGDFIGGVTAGQPSVRKALTENLIAYNREHRQGHRTCVTLVWL